MKKRLLFIAYFYPPLGGPGVQRPLKTIKYLHQLGWQVDVLTVSDIQFHSYDHELLKESKADNIYRTKSLDVMSLYKKANITGSQNEVYFKTPEKLKKIIRGSFPIDDKIGWYPFAYPKALELIRLKHYDAIVTTIGPYTSGLIAYNLHKKFKIPFFVDYRDHWTLHSYPQYTLNILKKHAEYYEKKILRAAHGIFVVSNLMKKKACLHFGQYLEEKTETVYNGFDEEDFNILPQKNNDGIRYIRYTGNFYGNRNVKHFIQALEELEKNKQIPDNIIFEFIGNYYSETLELLNNNNLKKYIKIIPQVIHTKAVEYMQTAALLLLFIPSKDGDDFMTGKIFEYIRARVPILAMIPENGEPAQILKKLSYQMICPMEDTTKIKQYLVEFFNSELNNDFSLDDSYSRENQTKIFSDFIHQRLLSSKNTVGV